MKKIIRQIWFNPELWEYIEEEAEKLHTRPNQWVIDLAARHKEGTLNTKPVARAASPKPPKSPKPEPLPLPEPLEPEEELSEDEKLGRAWGYDIPRIRKLQKELKEAKAEFDDHRTQWPDDEWEVEKNSWYIVEIVENIERLQKELREFIPVVEEEGDVYK